MSKIQNTLDYALFSKEQLTIANANFSSTDWKIAGFFQLRFNVNTNSVFRYKPTEIAKYLGIKPHQVYESIRRFNKCGYAALHISNMKVTGKLKRTAKPILQAAETDQGLLEDIVDDKELLASMVDAQAIKLLTEKNATAAQWVVALHLPMHCDLATGTVFEMRTVKIGDDIGYFRTTVDKAIEFLNEIGYCQIERDYVLEGRLPYTAYAFNQNNLKKECEAGVKDAHPHYAKKTASAFVRAKELLKKAYGIVGETLNDAEVVRLAETLEKRWRPTYTPDTPSPSGNPKRPKARLQEALPFG